MILSKIYSNKDTMRPIHFRSGLNVVYGDVQPSQEREHEHNLGKTSLAHLINFLLLKRAPASDPLVKYKEKFSGWLFFLELKLNDGTYLTIRRGFDEPSKISFKHHVTGDQNFVDLADWSEENVGLYSRRDVDAVTVLEKYAQFNVLTDYSIRFFTAYLLRTQEGYGNVFHPSEFPKAVDWVLPLFKLFGFDDRDLSESYVRQVERDIEKKSKVLNERRGRSKNNDAYALTAVIEEKEREKKKVSEFIEKFDFYLKEKGLSKKLVDEIETQISRLNSERYRADFEVARLKDALKDEVFIDLGDVEKVFSETKLYFPEQLKRSYQDLLKFNQAISKERAKFLKGDLKKYTEYSNEVSSELQDLNIKKEDTLKFLRSTDTFAKYKQYQADLILLSEQIKDFKIKLESLGTVEKSKARISDLNDEIRALSKKIKETIDKGSDIFDEIKRLFADLFRATMSKTALLIVRPNRLGNPDFDITTVEEVDAGQMTGEAEGYTAKKVQCAALVLSILATYSKQSFYRFAYHDGLFESWGDNPKLKFIQHVRSLCDEKGLQYIVSMIKSDVPEGYNFEDGEVIIELDKEHRLFGFGF